MEQRTPEWFAARCGKVTGSNFAKVMDRTRKGEEGATRKAYKSQIIAERLTGVVKEVYINQAMQWGIDTEEEAKRAYEDYTGNGVAQLGFITLYYLCFPVEVYGENFIPEHWSHKVGVSPDGLVDHDGLVEIKCPQEAAHIDNLIARKIPDCYMAQVQGQLWVTGRKWCDFVSYNPTFPMRHQIMIARVERDDEYIMNLEYEVKLFLGEVQEIIDKLEWENL